MKINRKYTLLLLAMTMCIGSAAAQLRIAHLADPQLGFGPGGFEDDLAAFRAEIVNVNAAKPDLVAIAGDMVNRLDSASVAAFHRAAEAIEAPVVLTPGNHDIAEPPTPAGLDAYRKAFGPDFTAFDIEGTDFTFIAFNSLLMRGGPADEVDAHLAKLRRALVDARARHRRVVLMCHVPPFAADIDEKDEYFNLPRAHRLPLMQMMADAGVVAWLCGHTHRTHRNDYLGIPILNPENTSCNFDKRPRGFRLLTIAPDNTISWDFVPNE